MQICTFIIIEAQGYPQTYVHVYVHVWGGSIIGYSGRLFNYMQVS